MNFFTLDNLAGQRLSELRQTADIEAPRRRVASLIRAQRQSRAKPAAEWRRSLGIKLMRAGFRLVNGYEPQILESDKSCLC